MADLPALLGRAESLRTDLVDAVRLATAATNGDLLGALTHVDAACHQLRRAMRAGAGAREPFVSACDEGLCEHSECSR